MRLFLILFMFPCFFIRSSASTCTALATGIWENAATWNCGQIPQCGDNIVIPANLTVTITTVLDYYTGCSTPMSVTIYGTLEFQTGKKLKLPCGSTVYVMAGGQIVPGSGGGNSNYIEICNVVVWNAGMGTLSGPVVLPIELLSFTATPAHDWVNFHWVTASEVNNDHFDVLRSTDGTSFTSVGTVPGSGNSNTLKSYDYSDTDPLEGTSYYRLRQTDYNGNYSLYNIVAVQYSPAGTFGLNAFPSPGNGEEINIAISGAKGKEVLVVLRNVLGEELWAGVVAVGTGNYIFAPDKQGRLPAGVYLVIAASSDKLVSKKITVQ